MTEPMERNRDREECRGPGAWRQGRSGPRSWRGWAVVVLACAAGAGLFSERSLRLSREKGRLSTVSNYDDVEYLDRASNAYFTARQDGVGPAARYLLGAYLHAPVTVYVAFLGFELFGPRLDGVYRALGLVVLAYLLALALMLRRLPPLLLGAFFRPALVVTLAVCAWDLFRSSLAARLRAGSILLLLGGLYLLLVVSPLKSIYLGAPFYAALLLSWAWALVRLYELAGPRPLGRPAVQAAVGLLLVAGAWSLHDFPRASEVYPEAAANQREVNRALLSDLLARTGSAPLTVLFTQAMPVIPEFLSLEFRAAGKRLVRRSAAMAASADEAFGAAEGARFVVVQDPAIVGASGDRIPGEAYQVELLERFGKSPGWALAATYPQSRGKHVYLFEQRGAHS